MTRNDANRINRSLKHAVIVCLVVSGHGSALSQMPLDYSQTCTTANCHDGYLKKKSVHAPIKQEACDACHEQREDEKHAFVLTAAGGELCLECHDDLVDDLKFQHGPVAAGECMSCHDPHASDYPQMLKAKGVDLCVQCHADLETRITSSKFVHQPVKEDCGTCHLAHGGDNRMNLTATVPELCLECHDDIADAIDDATVPHRPVSEGKSCMSCHDPHASGFEHGLLAEPMDVCLSCHNKELGEGPGKIINIAEKLAAGPNHHGPVAQKDCTSCHAPHGGEHHRLLVASYPKSFYAPYNEESYGICFECHESEIFDDETTEDATEFRNGDRNLHFLHVNKERKGRSCRACHDPHASSKPKSIADSVPFGRWAIPINFDKTETGGSCAPGCHKPYRYDRETPVENLAAVVPDN